MVSIDNSSDQAITISPDGQTAAIVTRQGDLARNVNVYRLIVFNIEEAMKQRRLPEAVAQFDVADDKGPSGPEFAQLQLHVDRSNGHPFATFLHGTPEQVYAVDAVTKEQRALTHHPTAVRAYAIGPDGHVAFFAAAAADTTDRAEFVRYDRLREDGVFTSDRSLLKLPAFGLTSLHALALMEPPAYPEYLEYFAAATPSAASRRILSTNPSEFRDSEYLSAKVPAKELADLLKNVDSLTISPDGRYALFWPFIQKDDMHPERWGYKPPSWDPANNLRVANQPFGLVDLVSGQITPLLDAPGGPAWRRPPQAPVWLPDGHLVVQTYLPLNASDPSTEAARAQPGLQWAEIDVATRRFTSLNIPTGWNVNSWDRKSRALFLTPSTGKAGEGKFGKYATLPRTAGGWSSLQELSFSEGGTPKGALSDPRMPMLNVGYGSVTNGELLVGVADNFLSPPEVAVVDRKTGTMTIVSDLNPELRQRRFGRVKPFYWRSPNQDKVYGILVLPPDTAPDKRVPLVIGFDRPATFPERPRFLMALDNFGVPVQVLANAGIGVLLLRGSEKAIKMRQVVGEGPEIQADYESAIEALASMGLIDKTRVGLTGWSYGGEVTDLLLVRSAFSFAAASKFDGGGGYYAENRPWTEAELMNVRAPLLSEAHGPLNLVGMSNMTDRLAALGKPVENLYFATAPHALYTPKHRWRAMTVHTDWFRFWLQDYEDPAPEKREQYVRWRKLREQRDANARGAQQKK